MDRKYYPRNSRKCSKLYLIVVLFVKLNKIKIFLIKIYRLFKSLESHIIQSLPSDTCEWKRSYGRSTIKNIKVEGCFKQLEICKTLLENYLSGTWRILNQPVLHIFISECSVF